MGTRKPEELVMAGINARLVHWCIKMEKKCVAWYSACILEDGSNR